MNQVVIAMTRLRDRCRGLHKAACLPALLLMLATAGCFSPDYALSHDKAPGLFIKGDVSRVVDRKVLGWMLLNQEPDEILVSAGVGGFAGLKGLGDMMVLNGTGYIKTTLAEQDLPFGDSSTLVETPFSFGIAKGHAKVLERGNRRWDKALSLDEFFSTFAENRAVLALVEFDHLEGTFHRKPPLFVKDSKDAPASYLTEVVYDNVAVMVFGVGVRDTEANRKDPALAEILKTVLGVNLEEKPSGKLLINLKGLLLRAKPDLLPAPDALAEEGRRYRYENVFQIETASTFKRASWNVFWIGHITPPPGRRYIEPKKLSTEPPPYIPLPRRPSP